MTMAPKERPEDTSLPTVDSILDEIQKIHKEHSSPKLFINIGRPLKNVEDFRRWLDEKYGLEEDDEDENHPETG